MAPGKYHIFGCIELSALDSTLGKGIPILAFPTDSPIPIRPPSPSGA
ncbi:hypothetical protein KKG31_07820 [Patescibacteria group bacterium]|nr:hypothetical protein [Patescibacteria group bacterium]MBU1758973.1 hypothetical protein [Patescibacteria group bacterium]